VRRLILLAIPLLLAAAPLDLHTTPSEPAVGSPFVLTVPLPSADATLTGIPPLGPFELLAPPKKEGGALTFLLLPMRPGRHTFPPLAFVTGPSRQVMLPGWDLTVVEGVAPDAQIAALKDLPSQKGGYLVPALFAMAGLVATFALVAATRRCQAKGGAPPLETLTGEALLAALKGGLEGLEEDEGVKDFLLRLERLRFSPLGLSEDERRELLAHFAVLTKGTP